MANVTLIPATVEAQQKAFGIVDNQGAIDLGDRVLDVLAIPGHHAAHVAYYDRKTGILLTGDHLYPGRLYVADFPAYVASTTTRFPILPAFLRIFIFPEESNRANPAES